MKTFKGGIHPEDNKQLSASIPISKMPVTEKIAVSVAQHLGKPAIPLVKNWEPVSLGQLIAKSDGFVSANIHSPVSGIVESIENYPHPVSGYASAIIIKTDLSKDQEYKYPEATDWRKLTSEEIKRKIADAGIVGLGGATFPTIVKLSPPADKKIDSIIINGVECEPYLTSDYRLMLEHTDELITGSEIIQKIMNVNNIYIGIESNKKDVYEKIKNKKSVLKPELLKLKYPQGAEKQLIDAILNRKVPPGKLPMDAGVVVINAGTLFAIYEAIVFNKPLIERIVTVSGRGITTPKNLLCKIGTLWSDIISNCGGLNKNSNIMRLILGGPMMGFAQFTDAVPVIKGCSGILVLTDEETVYVEEQPCIRCGKCIRGCPMNLMPSELNRFMDYNDIETLYRLNISDCIECGTCAYVCPANKKIIQKIRKYKNKVSEWAKKNVGNQ